MRGRKEESLQALAQLRRRSMDDETVQLEFKGILAEVTFQMELMHKEFPHATPLLLEVRQWAALFRPKYLKRTSIALAIPFFQQACAKLHFIACSPS